MIPPVQIVELVDVITTDRNQKKLFYYLLKRARDRKTRLTKIENLFLDLSKRMTNKYLSTFLVMWHRYTKYRYAEINDFVLPEYPPGFVTWDNWVLEYKPHSMKKSTVSIVQPMN
jgi:hypothetical protein